MSVVFDGPEQVNIFRMITLRSGLSLEGRTRAPGKAPMKLTRGPLCSTRVHEEFGDLLQNKRRDYADQYDRFDALCVAMGIASSPRTDWDNQGSQPEGSVTPTTYLLEVI